MRSALERVYTRIDCASRPGDSDLDTAGGDVHALADTDLDPTTNINANRTTHLNVNATAHRNINPTPDLNAAATDAAGHGCRRLCCQAGVAIDR